MTDFIMKHKMVRRLVIAWAMVMVSLVILHYITHGLGEASNADGVIITGTMVLVSYGLKHIENAGEKECSRCSKRLP